MTDRIAEAIFVMCFFLLALVIMALPASATIQVLGSPVANESITVSSTTIGITACGVGERALIQVRTNSIYYNFSAETATSAHYLGNTNDFIVTPVAAWFKAIRATGSDAELFVTCFK